jgi:hypothetical protein
LFHSCILYTHNPLKSYLTVLYEPSKKFRPQSFS